MIYQYKKIRELPDELVLAWWAERPAGQDYAAIVQLSRSYEVRTTVSEIRRDIRRRLLGRKYLPFDRAPTNEDYTNAKARWLSTWRNQPIY